jgi:hypothetical protein
MRRIHNFYSTTQSHKPKFNSNETKYHNPDFVESALPLFELLLSEFFRNVTEVVSRLMKQFELKAERNSTSGTGLKSKLASEIEGMKVES